MTVFPNSWYLPPFSPLALGGEVEMVLDESMHYAAGRSRGEGRVVVRKGIRLRRCWTDWADNRTFAVSFYHQEHCLLYLHRQLTNRTRKHRFPHHQYCLSRCATPT